jgi:hypothetical protein
VFPPGLHQCSWHVVNWFLIFYVHIVVSVVLIPGSSLKDWLTLPVDDLELCNVARYLELNADADVRLDPGS